MPIGDYIRNNERLKKIVHYMIVPPRQARPRTWVKWFVNPLFHKRGKKVIIRRNTRLDLLPFNKFEIGDYSVIESFATVNNGVGELVFGKHTLLGIGAICIGPVTVGDYSIIGQHTALSGLNHTYTDPNTPVDEQGVTMEPIIIGESCWIGANVVVVAGVKIGDHAVIGAGSVVTKDVPAFTVSVGNPAKVVRRYNEETKEWERVKAIKEFGGAQAAMPQVVPAAS